MAKNATAWKPTDSGTSSPANDGYSILLESGDLLLQETSDYLLLNESVVTTKIPIYWTE